MPCLAQDLIFDFDDEVVQAPLVTYVAPKSNHVIIQRSIGGESIPFILGKDLQFHPMATKDGTYYKEGNVEIFSDGLFF